MSLKAIARLGALALLVASALPVAAAETSPHDARAESLSAYEKDVAPFLAQHCRSCHGEKIAEKKLNLLALEPDMKDSTSAARWAVVLQQLKEGKMPPKEESRPAADAVDAAIRWIEAEMKRAGKHVARRAEYLNGNSVEHALLFDPRTSAEFDAPAGVRRLSPEIYSAFTQELAKGVADVGQPFSPAGRFAFKDMGAPKLDEPTTAQLLRNALLIVEKRLTAHKIENGQIKPAGQGAPKQFLRLLDDANPPSDAEISEAIKLMFQMTLRRDPKAEEGQRFAELYALNVKDAGRQAGANYTLAAVLLLPEAVFRMELGGAPDASGRVRLAPREIAYAIAYGLTDKRPDDKLLAAATAGELDTKEGIEKQVRRILDEPKLEKPRILRFFREYFGYDKATDVFKEDKDNPEHDSRVLVEDTDRLVLFILEQDQNVLRELLTTNKSFVAYKSAAETKKKRAAELAKFEAEKAKDPKKFESKKPPKIGRNVFEAYGLADFPDQQPVELPANQRAGILTQPSWLVAQSTSSDNHAIHRGKWVRERLLGGVVPDIPITVDAQLPIAPEKTLRERMRVTTQEYCWQCHRQMNLTGLPFEKYDHFGRLRTMEAVLDPEATAKNVDQKGRPLGPVMREAPLDTTGKIEHVGDPSLEGSVDDPIAMLHKLAASERVEQVFVRHAFRYWLGRNETLGDAASLQAAHKAYRESGGSMKALIASLMTSDSFLTRVKLETPAASKEKSQP